MEHVFVEKLPNIQTQEVGSSIERSFIVSKKPYLEVLVSYQVVENNGKHYKILKILLKTENDLTVDIVREFFSKYTIFLSSKELYFDGKIFCKEINSLSALSGLLHEAGHAKQYLEGFLKIRELDNLPGDKFRFFIFLLSKLNTLPSSLKVLEKVVLDYYLLLESGEQEAVLIKWQEYQREFFKNENYFNHWNEISNIVITIFKETDATNNAREWMDKISQTLGINLDDVFNKEGSDRKNMKCMLADEIERYKSVLKVGSLSISDFVLKHEDSLNS
jgi:hypothetical protein